MVVDEFFATLGLETDEGSFLKGFAVLEGLHHVIEQAFEKVTEVIKEAFSEIKNLGPETAAYANQMRKAAQRTGVGTDEFQELAFAAHSAGIDVGQLEGALFKMERAGYAARNGGEGATEAFQGLLSLDELKKLKPDEMFEELAEKLSKVSDVGKRNDQAMKIFGRSMGSEIIPLLGKGKEGIRELREEAHEFGMVLGKEAIEKAKQFAKTNRELDEAIEGVKLGIGETLLDSNKWKQTITDLIVHNRKLIVTLGRLPFRAIRGAIGLLTRSLKVLWNGLKGLDFILNDNYGTWGRILEVLGALAVAVELFGWKAVLAWAKALAPILAVAAGVVVLLAWLEDLQTFFEGGDSVIGDFIASIKDSFDDVWDFLLGLARWIIDGLFGADALAAVDAFAKAIVQKIGKAWDWIKDKAAAVAKFLHISTDANASMGGGASPAASAASSVNTSKEIKVNAPTVNAPITVNAAPGQSEAEIGNQVAKHVDERLQQHINDAQSHLES
jgi:hypothetical protein